MTTITQHMAQFADSIRFESIPQEARREAKRFLLDSLGCALAAVNNDDMLSMLRVIKGLGGAPQSTIIGAGSKADVSHGALMNSLLIRALDYNDIYWEQDPSHPSDLIGAALAVGEAQGRNGAEVLTAIVIGYELEMRWCHAAKPGIREVGWHHASLTQFVSPLVAGYLFGLTPEQLVAAVGISGSSHFTLGGVVAGHLTHMKNTADPLAVQSGVMAALMAREGIQGPEEVLEGKEGLFEVLNQVEWQPEQLTEGLGNGYLITRCSYKAFPTEALTHQPITAALQLREKYGLSRADIERVQVYTTTRGADILSDPSKYQPDTKETADHSLPYVIAVALKDGNVLPEAFQEEALFDPLVRELLSRIEVIADPEIDRLFPATKRARVVIHTKAGKTYTKQVDHAKGSPENPLSDEELIAKFMANSQDRFKREILEKIIEATMSLEQVQDFPSYMALVGG